MKFTLVQQQAIQARIGQIVGADSYDRLFKGASFIEVADRILYAFAPTEEQAADIEERFRAASLDSC
jgi:hypothetical protein